MITTVNNGCLLALAVSVAMCLYRLLRGPSVPDRALALDTLAINLAAMIVLLAIRYGTEMYLDAVLVIAILGFLGTVAVSKFLLKGGIID